MKLLITGANGFIGKSLCKQLLARKDNIVAPTRCADSQLEDEFFRSIPFKGLQYDINWIAMLNNVDVIVHLASRVHIMNDESADPLAEFRKINVDATLSLAKQAATVGVKRFVYISSIKVNGEATSQNKPFTAEDQPSPVDPYGVSKYEAETGLLQIANDTELEVVIIRPPLVYGPGVKANFLRMMSWLYNRIPLPFGAIHNKRSLVALDNLVDLIMTCVHHPDAANQIFLVSDGDDLSTTELLRRVSIALGKSTSLLPIPQKLLEFCLKILGKKMLSQRLCCSLQVDIGKTQRLLDWSPLISVDKAICETADAFLMRGKEDKSLGKNQKIDSNQRC